jgi:hypothetical protein
LADQSAPGMDQSTATLWLQEICWFPDAALSDTIQWEPLMRTRGYYDASR